MEVVQWNSSFQVRIFNSSELLPSEVHDKHSYSWKVLIIASVFHELAPQELLIYFDTSIRFRSPADNFGAKFFLAMGTSSQQLAPLQLGGSTSVTVAFATHPTMSSWIPIDPLVAKANMREANLMLWRRTEASRQVKNLKVG